ncbi:hypothetical protein PVL29_012868 [Vitis rotundifolia]|uniref:Uncharacterized protein n=1 Tax=Vitis rotundifolia TaxID=103349 RepID=A0AA38ZK65_VITRO|nr:hypothetical protein PVL29_012868 [Vitis rotundifolia]
MRLLRPPKTRSSFVYLPVRDRDIEGKRSFVEGTMIPDQWTSPCGNQCTKKYAAMQIAWRVFCKKGCYADGETWEECLEECNEICYKDPVFKDQQWSAYIDRSPGSPSHSKVFISYTFSLFLFVLQCILSFNDISVRLIWLNPLDFFPTWF